MVSVASAARRRAARCLLIAAAGWLTLPVFAADKPATATGPCRDLGGDMEQGFTTRCTLPEASMSDAYAFLLGHDRDAQRYLESTMPRQDFDRKLEQVPVNVHYHWTGDGRLDIQMDFAGGATTHSLLRQGQGVVLITVASPD